MSSSIYNSPLTMRRFYDIKTIQKSFKYLFFLEDYDFFTNSLDDVEAKIGFHLKANFRSWHYVDVTIPNYQFDRVSTMYGTSQRSFVTLPKEQNLNVKVVIEEDAFGNVAHLVSLLQQKIINPDTGLYRPPRKQYIKTMAVDILDDQDFVITSYAYDNVLFLGADDVTYSYGGSDATKFSFNFAVDRITATTSYTPDQRRSIVPLSVRLARRAIAAGRRTATGLRTGATPNRNEDSALNG